MLKQHPESVTRDDQFEATQFLDSCLPQLVGVVLSTDCCLINCRFDVRLTNGACRTYRMATVKGSLVTADNASEPPTVVYTTDAQTLLDIVTARCTPQDAFFAMRVEISGEMERGLELGAVFEDFFRFHPCRLEFGEA